MRSEMHTEAISLFGPAELYLDHAFCEKRAAVQRSLGVSIRLSRVERDGQVVWSGDVVPDRPLALASDVDPYRLLDTLEQQARASLLALTRILTST